VETIFADGKTYGQLSEVEKREVSTLFEYNDRALRIAGHLRSHLGVIGPAVKEGLPTPKMIFGIREEFVPGAGRGQYVKVRFESPASDTFPNGQKLDFDIPITPEVRSKLDASGGVLSEGLARELALKEIDRLTERTIQVGEDTYKLREKMANFHERIFGCRPRFYFPTNCTAGE
jgi:hypothetical protein